MASGIDGLDVGKLNALFKNAQQMVNATAPKCGVDEDAKIRNIQAAIEKLVSDLSGQLFAYYSELRGKMDYANSLNTNATTIGNVLSDALKNQNNEASRMEKLMDWLNGRNSVNTRMSAYNGGMLVTLASYANFSANMTLYISIVYLVFIIILGRKWQSHFHLVTFFGMLSFYLFLRFILPIIITMFINMVYTREIQMEDTKFRNDLMRPQRA